MTPAPRAGATDATSRDPVLEVRDLQVTFDAAGGRDVRAVRGLSYAVGRGEVLGIVGESGSGKSVSALAVMGLLPGSACARGSVVLNGRELLGMDDTQLSQVRGRSIAMVFQDPMSALTPVYTVGDQVAEAVRAHGAVPKEQARRRAIELLELVGIPDAKRRYEAFPHEFSGGMRQRVVIAIAIANGPDVILADEPTTALDVTVQAQILEVLRTAQRATGAAIVLITHDLGVVAGIADRVLVMYAGRGVEVGPVDAVYSSPRMPYTLGLLGAVPRLDAPDAPLVPIEGSPPSLAALPPGCPFSPRCPLVVDACRQIEPLLERVGPKGHAAACHRSPEIAARRLTPSDVFAVPPPKPPPVPAIRALQPIVLEVSDLSRHFPLVKGAILRRAIGTIRGVDGVSFDVRRGETLALVGESGSGKTTTLREVLELAAPPRGRIVVLGEDTGGLGRDRRAALRRDLSVVFQDPLASLDPRMPVADILAEPLHASRWSRPDARARVRELLDLVGLEASHASRFPQELSGGQRQRVAIARALALEPRLVVLDEPVSALDVSIRAGVINLLDQLKSRLSLSYLLVAHDLSVVRHLADRVAVLHLGRIVEIGGVATVYGAPAHPYTQALLSAIPIPSPAKERARRRVVLSGDLPNPLDPPSGCRFRTRCPAFLRLDDDARRLCLAVDPPLDAVAADHEAACHYAERVAMD